jgi:Tol biopolymer transport system component
MTNQRLSFPALRLAGRVAFLFWLLSAVMVGALRALAFQADQPEQLLYVNGNALYLWQLECPGWFIPCAWRDQLVLDGRDEVYNGVTWSPDGTTIALQSADGWRLFDADCLLSQGDCPPLRTISREESNDIRLAWEPEGAALAYVTTDARRLVILSRSCWRAVASEGCERRVVPLGIRAYSALTPNWSPTGQRIAFYNLTQSTISMLDVNCFDEARSCAGSFSALPGPRAQYWPAFSPDGNLLAFHGQVLFSASQIYLHDLANGVTQPITHHRDATFPAWSGDGRLLAYSELHGPHLFIALYDLERQRAVVGVRRPGRNLFATWGAAARES